MTRHFILTVHLHDSRFHGAGEWPPAPARVFQALLAGAAQGRIIPPEARQALEYIERLDPPVVVSPRAKLGQKGLAWYVPNNDLDSVGADPDRIGEIRTKKYVRPYLLEGQCTFLYCWSIDEDPPASLLTVAEGLRLFGRGIDPAWATGEILDSGDLVQRFRTHGGQVHRPGGGGGSVDLAVPTRNTLLSLIRRFEASLVRLRPSSDPKVTHFVQPPKAHFRIVRYDGKPPFHLFELRRDADLAHAAAWPTHKAHALVEHVRNTAVALLSDALPDRVPDIHRVLIGRRPDGTNAGPVDQRVRLIPLPSIGHPHADLAIRRVLVQVPPGPLDERDVLWGLSGRALFDGETGEVEGTVLVASSADAMVERYSSSSRRWRSVTPVVLRPREPWRPGRGPRAPGSGEPVERVETERQAVAAIAAALRHSGVSCSFRVCALQREPFVGHGTDAHAFGEGTRFPASWLWHVELEFDELLDGPLVLGDGRFLGLGVMEPVEVRGALAFDIEEALPPDVDPVVLARALRRAVMARAHAELGLMRRDPLPLYFGGHANEGEALAAGHSTHIAFSVDLRRSRLLILPPHVLDGRVRPTGKDVENFDVLQRAVEGMRELRAGAIGLFRLRPAPFDARDPLASSSTVFRSVTPYLVNRHSKGGQASRAIVEDVRRECARLDLPDPQLVHVKDFAGVPGVGLQAMLELRFAVLVRGPLILGRSRFLGGGLFEPVLSEGVRSVADQVPISGAAPPTT